MVVINTHSGLQKSTDCTAATLCGQSVIELFERHRVSALQPSLPLSQRIFFGMSLTPTTTAISVLLTLPL